MSPQHFLLNSHLCPQLHCIFRDCQFNEIKEIFIILGPVVEPASSDEDEPLASNHLGHENAEDEGLFVFKRHKPCSYQKVTNYQPDHLKPSLNSKLFQPLVKDFGNWPWTSKLENGLADPRYRYTLTSLRHARYVYFGL